VPGRQPAFSPADQEYPVTTEIPVPAAAATPPPPAEPPTAEPSTAVPSFAGAPPAGAPVASGAPVVTEVLAAGPDRPARPRRRLGTARLLLVAAVLGPVIGAGVGYTVQALRPPTPLPPLAVGPLSYPSAPLDAAAAAAAEPKPLNIDGDLRRLLIDRPAGTEEWDNYEHGTTAGWLTAGDKAMSYGNSGKQFRSLLYDGFRRDAYLAFSRGETHYRVELIQFGPDDISAGASSWMISVPVDGGTIPGTASGYYSAPRKPEHYDDSTETYYYGLATARRGSVIMRISVYSPNPVDANELKDLATRQWERLK
jgi:hypothetical protein